MFLIFLPKNSLIWPYNSTISDKCECSLFLFLINQLLKGKVLFCACVAYSLKSISQGIIFCYQLLIHESNFFCRCDEDLPITSRVKMLKIILFIRDFLKHNKNLEWRSVPCEM